MDWLLTNIIWADSRDYPKIIFLHWMNGLDTKAAAIDFAELLYDGALILSCDIEED